METKDKDHGAGIFPYLRNPNRVVLFLRTQGYPKHLKIDRPLPYAGMLDIIGGHLNKNDDGRYEDPAQCIKRELAEEWLDLRTGRPYRLNNYWLFKQFENNVSVQWLFAKELDIPLDMIEMREGDALCVVREEAAMRVEIAFECTEILREFFQKLRRGEI